ncbi:MAG: hypothetical protein E4G99_10645 [Anaerolineales bacterium]|nr:DUF2007 domain-containing protein [Anaerolineales bacterium]TFH33877.1 MAG: hypothetical protein E4G99_10645 [Anaerolineales bacterium]
MRIEFVLLDTVSGKFEAEIIHGMLQAYGIDTVMSHEAAASIYALGIGPIADVDLLVREDQLVQARQLLDDYRQGRLEAED